MSLANMSTAYSFMQMRVRLAEDSQRDFEELLAQWFVDSNPGAREFLREIARDHREKQASTFAVASATHPHVRVTKEGGCPT